LEYFSAPRGTLGVLRVHF
jgi:hypothetical protein